MGTQRSVWSWLTPSIFMWVVGIELGLLSFHGRSCTHWAVSPTPKLFIFYIYLFNVCVYMYIYVNTHGPRCTCGGQTTTAASSLFLLCKFQGSNSGCQPWHSEPLPSSHFKEPGNRLHAFVSELRPGGGKTNVNSWSLDGFLFDLSAQNSLLPTGVLSSSGGWGECGSGWGQCGVIRTKGRSVKGSALTPELLGRSVVFISVCHFAMALALVLKVKTNKMFHLFRSGVPKLQVWHWAVGLCECPRGDMRVSPPVPHSCGLSWVERAGGTEGG